MSDLKQYQYRERCLQEKGENCVVCESEGEVVVHHVNGDREDHRIENLIPVCRVCHGKIHARHEEVSKWVRKLGYEPRSSDRVTIEVEMETWRMLNNRFQEPGEIYDDVIQRLLKDENQDSD